MLETIIGQAKNWSTPGCYLYCYTDLILQKVLRCICHGSHFGKALIFAVKNVNCDFVARCDFCFFVRCLFLFVCFMCLLRLVENPAPIARTWKGRDLVSWISRFTCVTFSPLTLSSTGWLPAGLCVCNCWLPRADGWQTTPGHMEEGQSHKQSKMIFIWTVWMSRCLISNYCICTTQGLKEAYTTYPAKILEILNWWETVPLCNYDAPHTFEIAGIPFPATRWLLWASTAIFRLMLHDCF